MVETDYIKIKTVERLMTVKFRDFMKSLDLLYDEDFSFRQNKVYGILCNHGEGGWGLSYLLAGKMPIEDENVKVDYHIYCKNDYVEEGWYVGEGLNKRGFFSREMTVKNQISKALKCSNINLGTKDIISKFDLRQDRVGYKLNNLSWESWRASIAIGYAYGKKIFCFPWLDTAYLKDLILNTGFIFYINILKENGAVIIIPSSDELLLKYISDEMVILNNPRFHNYKVVKEYIEKQKTNILIRHF